MVTSHRLALGENIIVEGDQECLIQSDAVNSGNNNGSLASSATCMDNGVETAEVSAESSYFGVTSPAPDDTKKLGAEMGEPQAISGHLAAELIEKLEGDKQYFQNEVMVKDEFINVRDICRNKHELCAYWSLMGECDKNEGYMKVNCAPACRSCEKLDYKHRCPIDPNAVDALQPGDVNKLFERIANGEEYKQYEPIVMSRPPEGPWLILFENVLSQEEADRLIELGGKLGYERSTNVGKQLSDGTFDKQIASSRTSSNAWCQGECYQDEIAIRVMERVENITGIPETNSENLQLLRYGVGEFYKTHSDYIPQGIHRPPGVRILTFYFYLNDVEEGGGTKFPELDLIVTPKRGRAVLWPSVLDSDPNKKDIRTVHEAMPVIRGEKYGGKKCSRNGMFC
eukprot:CAMPEP_0178739980 /NCGR_PEP_ID=MMETSP0744-20121128/4345_1 /TAXON_ID=913974 /ORGANISM="Nitzschia punctata, Strain CCMP561" /LENGTH=397 /DNA_ID=CAMNT_0020392721 /DNA_START=74 /DNA_END=1267 /DNA_ORIENTATION=-